MKWTFSENLGNVHFDDAEGFGLYICILMSVTKCFHHTAFAFFPFQKVVGVFCSEFLFCNTY